MRLTVLLKVVLASLFVTTLSVPSPNASVREAEMQTLDKRVRTPCHFSKQNQQISRTQGRSHVSSHHHPLPSPNANEIPKGECAIACFLLCTPVWSFVCTLGCLAICGAPGVSDGGVITDLSSPTTAAVTAALDVDASIASSIAAKDG